MKTTSFLQNSDKYECDTLIYKHIEPILKRAVRLFCTRVPLADSLPIFSPKEFIDCVSHIRLLSWLLLGAMTHAAVMGPQATVVRRHIWGGCLCH